MRPFTLERLHALLAGAPAGTFWRHDVDVSPRAAVAMARFEAERGVTATYYVMWRSPFYTAGAGLELAAAVSALGHRVGVHVDFRDTAFPAAGLFSFHCPRPQELWNEVLGGARNAYHPRWEGRYVSDSRGVFAHGDPEDRFDGPPVQVNLHPEHWFAPGWEADLDPAVYEAFFHEPPPAVRA